MTTILSMVDRTAAERATLLDAQQMLDAALRARAEFVQVPPTDPLFGAAREQIRELDVALAFVTADVKDKRLAAVAACARAREAIANELTPERSRLIAAARKSGQAFAVALANIQRLDDEALELGEGSSLFEPIAGISERVTAWLDHTGRL